MFTGEKERNEKQHIFHLNCEHFWRQKTSKNCRFSSRVRYLCDCCVRCSPAHQSHLATGKSRFSQDLRWGVRPAASSSRGTDLNVLPLPVWSHSSWCSTGLWSPASVCECIQSSVVWSGCMDSSLVCLLQPLGLFLQGRRVGSLWGCSIQRVGSPTY